MPDRRAWPVAVLLVAVLSVAGCVSLQPWPELTAEIPGERFVSIGGRSIYVDDRGAGEPVVLLHGFGASSYSWRHVAEELALDHRVVAIDLPGFGFTERPLAKDDYTSFAQGELVLDVVEELGLDRVHLVGHSYGGALAMALAVRRPERLRTLTLVDAAGPEYPRRRRSVLAAWRPLVTLFVRTWALRPARVERGLRVSTADGFPVTRDLIDEYWRRLAVDGSPRAYWGLTAPAEDRQRPFTTADIPLPTLVVWGSEDALISVEGARRAAAAIPDSRFVILEGVGHLPMEERPEELVAVMRQFLREHASHQESPADSAAHRVDSVQGVSRSSAGTGPFGAPPSVSIS